MTEAEWLTCVDPIPMLEFLRGKTSDRKLRLFALLACRHSLQCFGHYDLDEVVDWADSHIEGTVKSEPSEAITSAVEWATTEMCESLNCLGAAVRNLISESVFDCDQAQQTAKLIIEAHQIADVHSSAENEGRKQSGFLRELFGVTVPFVSADPDWLTSTALTLATSMYDSREFSAMPILADALQDAGCDNDDILNHCRQPGEHVRGCWVVDLVLGKK